MGFEPAVAPVWAGSSAVFFNCPESSVDGMSSYWIAMARWCRTIDFTTLLDLPAADCDAMATIQAIERDQRNERTK